MKCRKCQFKNSAGIIFCGECGTELTLACPSCDASNPPQFKFCGEFGHNLTSPADAALPKDLSFNEKLAKIQKYLPGCLPWCFSMYAVPKDGAAQWEPADRKEPRKAVWTYPFQRDR